SRETSAGQGCRPRRLVIGHVHRLPVPATMRGEWGLCMSTPFASSGARRLRLAAVPTAVVATVLTLVVGAPGAPASAAGPAGSAATAVPTGSTTNHGTARTVRL